MNLRLASCVRSPKDADDRAAFEQRQIQRDGWDVAARESDHEIAAVPAHAANALFGQIRTYRVVHDVHSATIGEPCDRFLDCRRPIVEPRIRTVIRCERKLFL